jgi:hypothetical protein
MANMENRAPLEILGDLPVWGGSELTVGGDATNGTPFVKSRDARDFWVAGRRLAETGLFPAVIGKK